MVKTITKVSDTFLAKIDMKMSRESYFIYDSIFKRLDGCKSVKENQFIIVSVDELNNQLAEATDQPPLLAQALKTFQREAVYVLCPESECPNDENLSIILSLLAQSKYLPESQSIEFMLTRPVIPLVLEMHKRYPSFLIKDLSNLTRNKYALVIYKYLSLLYKKFLILDRAGQAGADKFKNPVLSVEFLRNLSGAPAEYQTRWSNFESRVIKGAVNKANETGELKISYEKLAYGELKTITDIRFHLSSKLDRYFPGEEQREAYSAIISEYTKLLAAKELLAEDEILNVCLMSRLEQKLFPILDQIKVKDNPHLLDRLQRENNPIKLVNSYVKQVKELNI